MKNSNDLYARGLRLSWSDFDAFITTPRDAKLHVCGIKCLCQLNVATFERPSPVTFSFNTEESVTQYTIKLNRSSKVIIFLARLLQ